MGCKFSSLKDDKPARSPPPERKPAAEKPSAASPRNGNKEKPNGKKSNQGDSAQASESPGSPGSPIKHPYANEVAAADDDALDDDDLDHVRGTNGSKGSAGLQTDARSNDSSSSDGGSGYDGNGSFANVDLNGSFHIHYNIKGDILPNAKMVGGRRSRSLSEKLIAGLSPHPSDDELVLVCIDCGMTINEDCQVLCPLTGKLHI